MPDSCERIGLSESTQRADARRSLTYFWRRIVQPSPRLGRADGQRVPPMLTAGYGRGAGVTRGLGSGVILGEGVGLGVGVGVCAGVAVAVAVGVGGGVGVPPIGPWTATASAPPVLKKPT